MLSVRSWYFALCWTSQFLTGLRRISIQNSQNFWNFRKFRKNRSPMAVTALTKGETYPFHSKKWLKVTLCTIRIIWILSLSQSDQIRRNPPFVSNSPFVSNTAVCANHVLSRVSGRLCYRYNTALSSNRIKWNMYDKSSEGKTNHIFNCSAIVVKCRRRKDTATSTTLLYYSSVVAWLWRKTKFLTSPPVPHQLGNWTTEFLPEHCERASTAACSYGYQTTLLGGYSTLLLVQEANSWSTDAATEHI